MSLMVTKRQVLATMLITFTMGTQALSPLTPRLDQATLTALQVGLSRSKLPEVAHHSVVLAITGALGFDAANRPIAYDSGYPHLPLVKGHVVRVSEQCARVVAQAWMPHETAASAVLVDDTFCLIGPAEWSSTKPWIGPVKP